VNKIQQTSYITGIVESGAFHKVPHKLTIAYNQVKATFRSYQVSRAFRHFITTASLLYDMVWTTLRTAHQATHWEMRGYKRKPGRPRKNWVDVIKRDLRQMDLTWEEAEELVNNKAEWRRRVVQCSHLDAG